MRILRLAELRPGSNARRATLWARVDQVVDTVVLGRYDLHRRADVL